MTDSQANPGEAKGSLANVPAVILCGGLGTRLRGVVSDQPKSLAPVSGRPFIDFLLEWLRDWGIQEVVLCTGYKADAIRRHCGNGASYGLRLHYSFESSPAGTGGALKLAESQIAGDRFVLLNGDSFIAADLGAALSEHLRCGAETTMILSRALSACRYGQIEMDARNQIRSLVEKPSSDGGCSTGRSWINAGVYLFERSIFPRISTEALPVSLERDVLPGLVGNRFYGFPCEGYFIDIGVPGDYLRAQDELPRRVGHVPSNSR